MDSDLWERKARGLDPGFQSDPTSLKARLQREYEDKLAAAKDLYEQRLRDVVEQTRSFYNSVQTDEVLNTMKQNAVSQQFVDFRVKELHEEALAKEREVTIDKLQGQLLDLSGKLSRTDQESKQLLKSLKETEDVAREDRYRADQLERQLTDARVELQQIQVKSEEVIKRKELELVQKQDGQTHLKRSSEQMAGLEQQLRSTVREMDSLRLELDRERARTQSLEKENQSLTSRLEDCSEDLREVSERFHALEANKNALKAENERLLEAVEAMEQESQSLHEKFSQYGQQVQEAINEESRSKSMTIETLQKKHAGKAKLFKRKIVEQKETIEDLMQELAHSKELGEELKRQYEKLMHSVPEDIKRVRDEWERKVQSTEQESQRRESDLVSKHQLQISSLQSQFQSLMDKKVAEMQSDAQTQVSKARMYDQEMKNIFEDRIKSIEKDYISIAKHESVVRDHVSKTRSEQEAVISHLKEALETQISQVSKELKTIKEDANKKVRELDQANARNIDLEKECGQLQESSNRLKEQLRQADSYNSDLNEKQRALVQHLESASENLQKLKTVCEDENRRRVSAEQELRKVTIELQEGQDLHRKVTRDQQLLQERVLRLEEDGGKFSQERVELRETIKTIVEENKNLEREGNDAKMKLEKVLNTRKEEGQRYERELANHMDTRNRLLQVESKTKALAGELQDYQQRCSELKSTLKRQEEEKSDIQQRLFKYETLLTSSNSEKSELQKRVEKARFSVADSKLRLKKMIGNRLSLLENDLNALRSSVDTTIHLAKKDVASDMQDLMYRILDQSSLTRAKYEQKLRIAVDEVARDWAMKARNAEEQLQTQVTLTSKNQQDLTSSHERQLEAYKTSLIQQKRDLRQAGEEIERLKRENLLLAQEKADFQSKLKQNAQAFDDLEKDIAKEATKIKQESDTMLEKSRRELVRKYEGEVRSLTKALEDVKAGKIQESQRYENALNSLRERQVEELKALRLEYEGKIQAFATDLENEATENHRLREELGNVHEEAAALQREHETALKALEAQIAEVEYSSKEQGEHYKALQIDRNEDADRLTKRIRELTKDLASKTEQIASLQHDKERQKSLFQELQKQLEEQSLDLVSLRTAKDKEIEYLKTLLNKTFTVPLGEIKRSNELHQETMELMERVKSQRRGPALDKDS